MADDICSTEASFWLIANTLTLKMTKTEFMSMESRQKTGESLLPALEINGTE